MENLKNKICKSLPYFCNAGMQAPKMAVKPEPKEESSNGAPKNNSRQAPWSIFGDVYWL